MFSNEIWIYDIHSMIIVFFIIRLKYQLIFQSDFGVDNWTLELLFQPSNILPIELIGTHQTTYLLFDNKRLY